MKVIAPIAAISAVLACITWVVLICRKQGKYVLSIYPSDNQQTITYF